MNERFSRRKFGCRVSVAATAISTFGIVTSKRTAAQGVIGQGDYQFQFDHDFAKLPEKYSWQISHGVTYDPDGFLYVIHEGQSSKTDHPSIFVFDPDGKFVRSFGQQYQGGGHGVDIRVEDGTPYLYVAAYQGVKEIAKLSLQGEVIWKRNAPMQTGVYADGEASNPQQKWGRDRFMPTNFAFLPDGDFLLADGYGSFYIHRYDSDGNYKSSFGGPGKGKGTFATPHGIWIDERGDQPKVVVADRAHNALQWFDLEGNYETTVAGFGLPANLDTHGDLLLVPELVARVSILGPDNKTVATLGDDVDRIKASQKENKGHVIRTQPQQWLDGKFVHPHDACFDADGNIVVAEWVSSGRLTKLTRV